MTTACYLKYNCSYPLLGSPLLPRQIGEILSAALETAASSANDAFIDDRIAPQ
jgi:hypothetical protein